MYKLHSFWLIAITIILSCNHLDNNYDYNSIDSQKVIKMLHHSLFRKWKTKLKSQSSVTNELLMRTLHFSRSITITFTNHKIEFDYEYDYTKELYSIASYRLRLQSYTPLIFTAKDSDQGYVELLYISLTRTQSECSNQLVTGESNQKMAGVNTLNVFQPILFTKTTLNLSYSTSKCQAKPHQTEIKTSS